MLTFPYQRGGERNKWFMGVSSTSDITSDSIIADAYTGHSCTRVDDETFTISDADSWDLYSVNPVSGPFGTQGRAIYFTSDEVMSVDEEGYPYYAYIKEAALEDTTLTVKIHTQTSIPSAYNGIGFWNTRVIEQIGLDILEGISVDYPEIIMIPWETVFSNDMDLGPSYNQPEYGWMYFAVPNKNPKIPAYNYYREVYTFPGEPWRELFPELENQSTLYWVKTSDFTVSDVEYSLYRRQGFRGNEVPELVVDYFFSTNDMYETRNVPVDDSKFISKPKPIAETP